MTTITWINDDGKTCVLSINDERNTTTALTPAADPFTTSIQESDDLFTPIRTGNGYIRVVVDSVDDISYLVGAAPLQHAVYLTVGSTQRWKGFLACESFTQSWDKGPMEIELPVISPLEAAKGFYPSAALADLGYINIAQFLYNLSTSIGASFTSGSAWSRFYFPVISNTPATLKYYFDRKNYATATDKNTAHEMASYYDILEDICKLFGWQAIEYEYELVFMAADVKKYESVGSHNANYKGYNLSRMLQIATGGSSDVNDRPYFEAVIPTIFGADHDMTWIAGKKKVEVTGQLNEREETIWSMDVVSQCVYKGSENHQSINPYKRYNYKKSGAYTNGNIIAYNSLSQMEADTNGYNIKYHNYVNSGSAYGGCATIEWFAQYNNNHELVAGKDEFIARIITKAYSTNLLACCDIHTNFWYEPTQNKAVDGFRLEGDIKYTSNAGGEFVNIVAANFEFALMIVNGNTTYYWSAVNGWTTTQATIYALVLDGKIESYGDPAVSNVASFGYIPAPDNISGELVVRILSSVTTQNNYYYAFENLQVKMIATGGTRGDITISDNPYRENENQKKLNLNNGFTESWSQDCGLTLAREAVPDSYGVVLDANKAQPASLYDNKWPEDALAARASDYYQKARLRVRAIVESHNKMLSPLVPYTFTQGGKPFIVMEQQHNWRTGEVRANFYEPTYDTL